jgi:hypothetical protein
MPERAFGISANFRELKLLTGEQSLHAKKGPRIPGTEPSNATMPPASNDEKGEEINSMLEINSECANVVSHAVARHFSYAQATGLISVSIE